MNPPAPTSVQRPSAATPAMTTVAGYLLTRLTEAGVISVFGVPGDYNLGILDAIADRPSLAWVGMATEQGAGYAADSYARQRGLGALVTTFGVGELSAMNAIAGAYAESVPVVHIVGTPALPARLAGVTLHHNLPGADFGHYARMAAEVTEAQADLQAGTAPAEIDRVLRAAVRTSRPVYLAIPADVADAPVPAPAGPLLAGGQDGDADPAVAAAFARHARRVLGAASSASLLLGHLAGRHGVTAQVRDLAAAGDLPVAVLSTAKGDFPESDPRFMGLYAGAASAKPARLAVEDADVLITVGVTLTDTVTGGGTHQLPEDRRIDLAPGQARIGRAVYGGLGLRQALTHLTRTVRASYVPAHAGLADAGEAQPAPAAPADPAAPLTQQQLWSAVERFLLPGDLVVADQGTAFYGAAGLTLPDEAKLIGQPQWASIGWAVPAALGASLAAPDRRVVLITGDGAGQQTAPELGTLLAQGMAPVVIVLDNGGYAVERVIHNPAAAYHHIPSWDWAKLPAAVARDVPAVARRAVTAGDLDAALLAAGGDQGLPVLIEAVLGWTDAPPLLRDLARVLATSDSYSG
ncbi:MAG TPA: thiamine pyrophosphate-binding protein [Streptosporangiaceae bacterium]|nr:thiamine pyrophosphate-binding protein [Streptosporangiaceae bacterium]